MPGSFDLRPPLKSVLLHLVQAVLSKKRNLLLVSHLPTQIPPTVRKPTKKVQINTHHTHPTATTRSPCLSAAQKPQQTMESPTIIMSATYPAARRHISPCRERSQGSRCNKYNRCKRCSQCRHRQRSPKRRKRKPSGAWSGAGPYVSCLLAAVSKEVVCYGERCEML